VFGITFNPKFPYYEQWSLDVQHQLGREVVLQVAYVGSHGLHLPRAGEANPFEPVLGRHLSSSEIFRLPLPDDRVVKSEEPE